MTTGNFVATRKNSKMALFFLGNAITAIVQLQKLTMHVVRSNGELMNDPRMMSTINGLVEMRKNLMAMQSETKQKIDAPMTPERVLQHKIKNRAGSIVMSLELNEPAMTMKMIDNGVEVDGLDAIGMTKVAELVQKHGHSNIAMEVLNYVKQMNKAA